jgi:GDPmannose 4,6-dehydratase
MLSQDELNKVWLVIGVTGQDGSWMVESLLEKGYKHIHGTIRRSATFNTSNIDHIFNKLTLHYADLTDSMNIYTLINKVKPDYIVNFAAMSHVKVSEEISNYTFQVNTLGVLNILQSVRNLGLDKTCKIYQASTSEMFGNNTDGSVLLNEESPMNPISIYAISKKAAQEICDMYRDAYNMFVVNSVLFNHEGSRRGHTFVTQKIADYVANYNKANNSGSGSISPLQLGNLNARRDWGDAKNYVEAIYLILMQNKPENFVIATGETHSVREFVELAFKEIGVNIKWEGSGVNEKGIEIDSGKVIVKVNPKYYRDIDIECLIGDSSKAQKVLGWKPTTTFKELVNIMVKAAIDRTTN